MTSARAISDQRLTARMTKMVSLQSNDCAAHLPTPPPSLISGRNDEEPLTLLSHFAVLLAPSSSSPSRRRKINTIIRREAAFCVMCVYIFLCI